MRGSNEASAPDAEPPSQKVAPPLILANKLEKLLKLAGMLT